MFNDVKELQQALYDLFSQDGELMAQVEGVHDGVPVGVSLPCLAFGAANARDWSTKSTRGTQVMLEVHVLSEEAGRAQNLRIMDRVATLLRQSYLELSSLSLIAKQVEQGQAPELAAEEVMRGTVRLRAFMEAVGE